MFISAIITVRNLMLTVELFFPEHDFLYIRRYCSNGRPYPWIVKWAFIRTDCMNCNNLGQVFILESNITSLRTFLDEKKDDICEFEQLRHVVRTTS
jgi:hypothetical protein